MKLDLEFELLAFSYTSAITVGKKKLDHNRLLRVDVLSDGNLLGTVDLSNLPYFHQYNLEEWQYTLDDFFSANSISLQDIQMNAPYFNMILNPTFHFSGELLFIIESVLFVVVEKKSPQIINKVNLADVLINDLYSPSILLEKTPECLKIKIRPDKKSLLETQLLLRELLLKKPEIKLRLDGNRTFELAELLSFMNDLETFCESDYLHSIEYLEEPLKNVYEYKSFFHIHPYPLAFDESLAGFIRLPAGSYAVIKPSLFGISHCLKYMEEALRNKIVVVISSSYETRSAMRPLLFLAAHNPHTWHGLDTLKFLPKDL